MGDVLLWVGVVMCVFFNFFIVKFYVIFVVDGICYVVICC